jgi:uncharacterized membrane protein
LKWLGISVMAAVLGMIADSHLGASLQRRGMLNNDSVNFEHSLSALAGFGLRAHNRLILPQT